MRRLVGDEHPRILFLELQIDTERLEAGDLTELRVVVYDVASSELPSLPTQPGVNWSFRSQMQSTSIVNGRMSRSLTFLFDLVATREGTFDLGPATVGVQDQGKRTTLTSNALQIQVRPRATNAARQRPLQASTQLTPDRVWEGQVFFYTREITSNRDVANVSWENDPDRGFKLSEHVEVRPKAYRVASADGSDRWVHSTTIPLIATEAGSYDFKAPLAVASLTLSNPQRNDFFSSFFQRTERKVEAADAMHLDVMARPPAPSGFSGLVGEFEVTLQSETKRPKVGQEVSIRMHLQGGGAIDGAAPPKWPTIQGARLYPRNTQRSSTFRQDKLLSSITVRAALVPTQQGRVTVPPMEWLVFSPEQGRYVTLRSNALELMVAPGEEEVVELTSFADSDQALPEAPPPESFRGVGEGLRWRLPLAAAAPWVSWIFALPLWWFTGRQLRQRLTQWWAQRRGEVVVSPFDRWRGLERPTLGDMEQALADVIAWVGPPTQWPASLEDQHRALSRQIQQARYAAAQAPPGLASAVGQLLDALEKLS